MGEYIVEVNDHPTIKQEGWSVRCDDLFIQREEIVRCRDCRNYHPDEGTLMRCRFKIDGFVQWRNAEADGFCAWGKRRGDAE